MIDVAIIGSGPGGLWAADTLSRKKLNIVIFEKNRYSSGGLINDCKLNLCPNIGMDLRQIGITKKEAEEYIKDIDQKFINLGADEKIYGLNKEKIRFWKTRAKWAGVELIVCKQRHIGTDKAKQLVDKFTKELRGKGVKVLLETEVISIDKGDNSINDYFTLKTNKGIYKAKKIILSPGRDGSYWLRNIAKKLGIRYRYGPIDIGVRIEIFKEVMKDITETIYDPKLKVITKRHRDIVRTFCTNHGGYVRIESDNGKGFKLINGDALRNKKSENTNLAILNTVELTEPFADTLAMGRDIAINTNRLGGGKPLAQRMGDFLEGRRSKKETFFNKEKEYDLLRPTLPINQFTPGDITLAYPGRIIENIREGLIAFDKVVPGITHPATIIYAPEIKFYNTIYETNREMETNIKGIYIIGDGSGKSRGIVGAALTGIIAGKSIIENYE